MLKVAILDDYQNVSLQFVDIEKLDGKYEIKTDSGYDDITGYPSLQFTGEATTSSFHDVSAIADIKLSLIHS